VPCPRSVFFRRDPVGAGFRIESLAQQIFAKGFEDQTYRGDGQEEDERQQDPGHHEVQDHRQFHPGPFDRREDPGGDERQSQEQGRHNGQDIHGLRPLEVIHPMHDSSDHEESAGHNEAELAEDFPIGLEGHGEWHVEGFCRRIAHWLVSR